jgi:hypothetical protein
MVYRRAANSLPDAEKKFLQFSGCNNIQMLEEA